MKITILALFGLFVCVLHFVPATQNPLAANPNYETYRAIITTTIFALLALEGFLVRVIQAQLLKLQNRQNEMQTQYEAKIKQLENDLDVAHLEKASQVEKLAKEMENNSTLSHKLIESDKEISHLQTAFKDIKHSLEQAKTLISSKASETHNNAEVISLLSLLQQKGRFLDFVMTDISPYSDAQIGGVARILHQGCSKVLNEFFAITPLEEKEEGSRITLEEITNPHQFKFTGNLRDSLPINGTIVHKGWATSKINLPKMTDTSHLKHANKIITPVEIDLH